MPTVNMTETSKKITAKRHNQKPTYSRRFSPNDRAPRDGIANAEGCRSKRNRLLRTGHGREIGIAQEQALATSSIRRFFVEWLMAHLTANPYPSAVLHRMGYCAALDKACVRWTSLQEIQRRSTHQHRLSRIYSTSTQHWEILDRVWKIKGME